MAETAWLRPASHTSLTTRWQVHIIEPRLLPTWMREQSTPTSSTNEYMLDSRYADVSCTALVIFKHFPRSCFPEVTRAIQLLQARLWMWDPILFLAGADQLVSFVHTLQQIALATHAKEQVSTHYVIPRCFHNSS